MLRHGGSILNERKYLGVGIFRKPKKKAKDVGVLAKRLGTKSERLFDKLVEDPNSDST